MLEEITLKINEKREMLNEAIAKEESYSKIYRLSAELDELILNYYRIKENEDSYTNSNKIYEDENLKIPKLKVERKHDSLKVFINFFKNRKMHKEIFNDIMLRVVFWLFGVILFPNILVDITQKMANDNIVMWNLVFIISATIFNVNLLIVTMKIKDIKHIIGLSFVSVFIYTLRYYFMIDPLKVFIMFTIPLTLANICMIYTYQYLFFNCKMNLTFAGVLASIIKIFIAYVGACLCKLFINDEYITLLVENILEYHQVLLMILATLIRTSMFAYFMKKKNIEIKKYDFTFEELFERENKIKKHKRIRTLVDY